MNDLKQLAAATAIKDMFERGWLNICAVDKIGEMLAINVKNSEYYPILHTLHCVHFNRMDKTLRESIPLMLKDCFKMSESITLEQACDIVKPDVEVKTAQLTESKSWMKKIGLV